MDHLRRGNRDLIKDINRALVVDQVRTNGPLSRTEIAKRTKLGLSTVTKIIDDLLAQRIVEELGEGDSSGGRKPINVGLNYDYGYVVGVKIEKERVILAATDLRPMPRKTRSLPFPAGSDAPSVAAKIVEGLKELMSGSRQPCLGIGIGVSGLVNKDDGELLHSSLLGWGRTDFRGFLHERFGLPVFVDNDVNAYTLAELLYGLGREIDNFILVTIGAGVGAGLVLNGGLYRGEYGGAGEIGHMMLFPDGHSCYCGRQGCLETYVNDAYIIREANRTSSTESGGKRTYRRIEEVLAAAETGVEEARAALRLAGRNLGIGILNLVNALNPGAVILAGEGMAGRQYIVPAVEEVLHGNFFAGHQPEVRLLVSALGDDAWVIGAAAMVLNELFQAPIYRTQRMARLF